MTETCKLEQCYYPVMKVADRTQKSVEHRHRDYFMVSYPIVPDEEGFCWFHKHFPECREIKQFYLERR